MRLRLGSAEHLLSTCADRRRRPGTLKLGHRHRVIGEGGHATVIVVGPVLLVNEYATHACKVSEIEAKTGLDLFANLPDDIEATAEANASWDSFKSF